MKPSPSKRRPERFAVYIAGEITQRELEVAMREAGLVLRSEAGHRLVIDRVPDYLRKPVAPNVVPLLRRRKGSR